MSGIIQITKNDDLNTFDVLEKGDIFEFENGYYMKINFKSRSDNAICIETGIGTFFDQEVKVKCYDAKLILLPYGRD